MNTQISFRDQAMALHSKLGELTYVAEGLFQIGASIEQDDVAASMIPDDYPFKILMKYAPEIKELYNMYDDLLGHEVESSDLEMGLHEVRWLTDMLVSLPPDLQEKALNMGFYTLANTLRRMRGIVSEQLGLNVQGAKVDVSHE